MRYIASWLFVLLGAFGLFLSFTWIPAAGLFVITGSAYLAFTLFCIASWMMMFGRSEERLRRGMAIIWALGIPIALLAIIFLTDMCYVATTIK
jgi:hypothetical protein